MPTMVPVVMVVVDCADADVALAAGVTMLMAVEVKSEPATPSTVPGAGCCKHPMFKAAMT